MKILVVGSDYGTVDMVNEAHKCGDYVVVADYYEETLTKSVADESWTVSTLDIDALEDLCRKNGIEAVTFAASDLNVTNGRQLAKRLGLPCYCSSDVAWGVARNKGNFKEICKKIGAPIATDYVVSENLTDEELDKITFPVVVKPVDRSANRGMSYCNDKDELRAAYKVAREISDNPRIIVERRLYGPEFVANYVIADGKAVLNHLSAEHHQPGQKANLYSIINTTSCHLKQYLKELNDYVIKTFELAEFNEGIAWVECMLDQDGHFYLIEPGFRFCGEMTAVPYGHISGFNGIKWMLDIAKGVKHTHDQLPPPLTTAHYGSGVSYLLFAHTVDTVERIEGLDAIEKIPNVVIDIRHRKNFQTRYLGTLGVIRFPAYSEKELLEYIAIINDNLRVLNAKGEDLIIHYTDYDSIKEQYENGLKEFGFEVR